MEEIVKSLDYISGILFLIFLVLIFRDYHLDKIAKKLSELVNQVKKIREKEEK